MYPLVKHWPWDGPGDTPGTMTERLFPGKRLLNMNSHKWNTTTFSCDRIWRYRVGPDHTCYLLPRRGRKAGLKQRKVNQIAPVRVPCPAPQWIWVLLVRSLIQPGQTLSSAEKFSTSCGGQEFFFNVMWGRKGLGGWRCTITVEREYA